MRGCPSAAPSMSMVEGFLQYHAASEVRIWQVRHAHDDAHVRIFLSFLQQWFSGYAGVWVEVDVLTTDLVGGGVTEPPQGVTLQLQDSGDNSRYGLAASFAVPQGNRQGGGATRASVFLPFTSFVRSVRWGTCGNCRLDTSAITGIDIYVLYQPGPFAFTVRTIKAVQSKADDIPVETPLIPKMNMDDKMVRSFIETTIERGSMAYNKGVPDVCGAVYDCAMRQIAASSGPSQAVKDVAAAAVAQASQYDYNTDEGPAWIYRRGFDTIINAYKGLGAPAEDNYPVVARGTWANVAITSSPVPQVCVRNV